VSFAARLHRRGAAPAAAVPAVAMAPDVVVAPAVYVGLVTRAIAFGLDAALINAVAIVFSSSGMETIENVSATIAAGGALYVLWVVGYFVTFWSTTGQTPGNRMLRIRVRAVGGERLLPRRSLLRFVGLTLAALPLFLGFLIILIDDRRRGLQDRLARTVVVEDPREAPSTRRPVRRAGP